jgi:hypothetical protein
MMVEQDQLLMENKAVKESKDVHLAQMLTYFLCALEPKVCW